MVVFHTVPCRRRNVNPWQIPYRNSSRQIRHTHYLYSITYILFNNLNESNYQIFWLFWSITLILYKCKCATPKIALPSVAFWCSERMWIGVTNRVTWLIGSHRINSWRSKLIIVWVGLRMIHTLRKVTSLEDVIENYQQWAFRSLPVPTESWKNPKQCVCNRLLLIVLLKL